VDPEREPHLARWLELARPARERAAAAGAAGEELCEEAVRANVLLQCENLRTHPCVREAEAAGRLAIHPWLYNLRTGELLAWGGEEVGWAPVAPAGE
jgi:carbonic anhydrase